jgi:pyridoxamine 5'-phosphate oxidase family protein
MTFTDFEIEYLIAQDLGRLATIQRDGSPQVSPVSFGYNDELETIDVGGFFMSTSQKYRNVIGEPRVGFVVDDIASKDPYRVRCLDIRGVAEAIPGPERSGDEEGADGAIIRIYPRRIISFGIDRLDIAPHLLVPSKRDVAPRP